MTYTARPPAPSFLYEFKVEIRSEHTFNASEWDNIEREIAEAVAAQLGLETTVAYEVPF